MKKSIINKHDNCQPLINWGRTNSSGQPALCCSRCRDRKGRLAWIDWISKDQLPILQDIPIAEITTEMAEIIDKHA